MANGKRVTLASLDQKVDDLIKSVDVSMETFSKLLLGTEASPGMVTRVDRIEQLEKNRAWKTKALWTTSVGALAAHIARYLWGS